MGYTGLKSVFDGDDAAGLAYMYVDAMTKLLRVGLKEKGNSVNPSGAVNIALFTESFILPVAEKISWTETEDLLEVLRNAFAKLDDELNEGTGLSADEWGGNSNKVMHLRAYSRLLTNLAKAIHTIETHADRIIAAMPMKSINEWREASLAKKKKK
jgi:hypothetical protein